MKLIALISFLVSGTLTVEQIYQDRDKFATLVREVAAPDVGRMGIEILSFTIKVTDTEFIPGFVFETMVVVLQQLRQPFAFAPAGCV